MRRSFVIRFLALLLVVTSITFAACGVDDSGTDGGSDGGRHDAGDGTPMSGVP